MRTRLLGVLRCPLCGGVLRLGGGQPQGRDAVEHGQLHCADCRVRYPIVAGIPILKRPDATVDIKDETSDSTLLRGPRPESLLRLLDDAKPTAAFAALLNPVGLEGNVLVPLDEKGDYRLAGSPAGGGSRRERPAGWIRTKFRRAAQRRLAKWVLPRARLRLATALERSERELAALDVLRLYYREYSGSEMYNYFAYRMGQPRHLAALLLAWVLARQESPLLDVACGVGHLEHYLTNSEWKPWVIGFDRDFFRLYVASKYVAPGADYVCAEADAALPFRSDVFGGAICSDAFHLFVNRALCLRELRRVVSWQGLLVLTRIGNAEVEPREGYELSVAGYRRLFQEVPHVLLGEDGLVKRYLQRRAPDLTPTAEDETLERQKWISVVSSRNSGMFGDHGGFEDWPHTVGIPRLNPLYVAEPGDNGGGVSLRLEFPSSWYAFENGDFLSYAPRKCRVSQGILDALRRGIRTQEMEGLMSQMVILGFPERYF